MREKSFYRAFIEFKEVAMKDGNTLALNILGRVSKYAIRGEFSSYKKAGVISRLFLEGNSDSFVSMTMGISESTVRVQRRNLSKELYDIFGSDFFGVLRELPNSKAVIMRRLYLAENLGKTAEELLYVEILSQIRECASRGYSDEIDIKDCSSEISFLVNHCRQFVHKELGGLDPAKLNYVMSVLDGRKGSTSDRFNLLRLLIGKEGDS